MGAPPGDGHRRRSVDAAADDGRRREPATALAGWGQRRRRPGAHPVGRRSVLRPPVVTAGRGAMGWPGVRRRVARGRRRDGSPGEPPAGARLRVARGWRRDGSPGEPPAGALPPGARARRQDGSPADARPRVARGWRQDGSPGEPGPRWWRPGCCSRRGAGPSRPPGGPGSRRRPPGRRPASSRPGPGALRPRLPPWPAWPGPARAVRPRGGARRRPPCDGPDRPGRPRWKRSGSSHRCQGPDRGRGPPCSSGPALWPARIRGSSSPMLPQCRLPSPTRLGTPGSPSSHITGGRPPRGGERRPNRSHRAAPPERLGPRFSPEPGGPAPRPGRAAPG